MFLGSTLRALRISKGWARQDVLLVMQTGSTVKIQTEKDKHVELASNTSINVEGGFLSAPNHFFLLRFHNFEPTCLSREFRTVLQFRDRRDRRDMRNPPPCYYQTTIAARAMTTNWLRTDGINTNGAAARPRLPRSEPSPQGT